MGCLSWVGVLVVSFNWLVSLDLLLIFDFYLYTLWICCVDVSLGLLFVSALIVGWLGL